MSSRSDSTNFRVGISGWTYTPWRGVFYPRGLRQTDELAFASRQLNSIEINGTFYSLQRPESFAAWYAAVPDDFVFSLKAPRFITHIKRLNNIDAPLANFFASGVLALGKKLGPILWQLPPSFKFDGARLAAFFEKLPRTQKAAEALARKHDDKVEGRELVKATEPISLKYALEVRHDSFQTPELLTLLKKHDIALCIADTAGKWPQIEELTAGFAYVRLHGADQLYVSGYTPEGLDAWARKIRKWGKAGPVFVYFDNDVKVRSPADAIALSERLGVAAGDARFAGFADAPKADGRVSTRPVEKAVPRSSWPSVRKAAAARPTKKRAGAKKKPRG